MSNPTRQIDPFIVLRAQAGDREALDELLRSIQMPLYRYLRAVVRDEALTEDLLQDVLFRIYRKLVWLREPALLLPWSFRIASREAFRRMRKLRRLNETPLEHDFAAEPDEPAEELEAILDQLPSNVDALSPASRAVLSMHYWEGFTLQQVAEVLDISIGTVKSRLAYGLRLLRRALERSS